MLNIFFGTDRESMESNVIADASNRLDVGEFQVFQLGYEAWYGKEADIKYLERIFFAYLLESKIASWAQHYARRIIALDNEGKLDSNDPQYHRFDAKIPYGRSRNSGIFQVCFILFLFFFFIGISIILLDGVIPLDLPCWYPPCHWVR